jgi:hypothetical protein
MIPVHRGHAVAVNGRDLACERVDGVSVFMLTLPLATAKNQPSDKTAV